MYRSQEPNFIWYTDGYDKLKPFGFPFGAIDGFSMNILWFDISPSNKDPKIISYFCVNCIGNLKFAPRTIR